MSAPSKTIQSVTSHTTDPLKVDSQISVPSRTRNFKIAIWFKFAFASIYFCITAVLP